MNLLLFIVLTFSMSDPALRGLAMATQNLKDVALLQVDFYYTWGWCDAPKCIPMMRAMQLPPTCPPMLLVGNEPNAIEPYGAPVTPREAQMKVGAIQLKCPNTYLIVGNVSADDWVSVGGKGGSGLEWIKRYKVGLPRHAIGAHCYSNYAAWCISRLREIKLAWGGEMWVTEFAILSGNVREFRILTNWLDRNTVGYAAYTNRQVKGAGYTLPYDLDLINADGILSALGKEYMHGDH